MAELNGVQRRFAGGVEVLSGIDAAIHAGEVLAVTGRSGSGKSTLLHILGLLDRPDDGTISILGIDVLNASQARLAGVRRRFMGFVFQDSLVDPARAAWENVELALRARGLDRAARRRAAEAALATVGLDHRTEALAATLSGGERQRLALARSIVHDPRLVLCDEPTGNLDETTAQVVVDLLEATARSGKAVVIVTHDLSIAERADRWAELRSGRLRWR